MLFVYRYVLKTFSRRVTEDYSFIFDGRITIVVMVDFYQLVERVINDGAARTRNKYFCTNDPEKWNFFTR
jgi:hypothetical protein